jgi:hypothetical protein
MPLCQYCDKPQVTSDGVYRIGQQFGSYVWKDRGHVASETPAATALALAVISLNCFMDLILSRKMYVRSTNQIWQICREGSVINNR